MKACVLENKSQISYKEIETPQVKENEVLIKVKSCGICSSDFHRVYADSAYFFPIVLGHEFSGEIVECGASVDKDLLGKKAVVFPLLPCMECEFCKQKSYAQCKNYKYFGSRCDGAMAEYISVPTWNIKILPDDMLCKVGALCEPAAVGVHAANKIVDFNDKTVCVVGTGVIGIICGIVAKTRGAEVSFVVRNAAKKEFLQSLGFDNFVASDTDNKFDVVIECVGSNSSINSAVELVKSKGEIVFVGNPEGDITFNKAIYWKILRSELTVKGIWNSSYKHAEIDDWDMAIEFLYENQETVQKLITNEFKLSDGILAFEQMRNGTGLNIKGVFVDE